MENGDGPFGVYSRMLAIRPGQKRQRVENRGFTIVWVILVQPFHVSAVLMVACVVSTFVRPVKGCGGLHVIPFSRGLLVELDCFLYQFPTALHVGISRQIRQRAV